ncbi:MAG: hypothetical protein E7556_01595 [Ruminococcaceae bacterium]|nr:hypothetical protein [Oscillospiraceae bacterium]
MKKIVAVFLVLTLLFVLVGCGKKDEVPTTTTPYVDTGLNNNYNNDYVSESYIDTTYSDSVTDTLSTTILTTSNQSVTHSNQSERTTLSETVADKPITTNAPNGLTPDSIESNGGIEKATYNMSERTYIVYYMSELLTHNSKYPIVSWANGTGCPPSLYDGLLRELASAGFIVVASDETMAANGSAQIAAIDFLIEESNNSVSVLYKKVNTSRIGVIGHSQGGRSAVNAGAIDSRITCVLSLAGSNFVEEAEKLSKPVLFMAGSKDKVVDPQKWIVTAFDAVKGPAVYASLNGAIHTTCCSNPTAYSSYAINWFNAWFYNDGNLKSMFTDGGALANDANWSGFMCKGF